MLDYLNDLGTVFTILVGWLLGLLTPGITERIRRPYRRRDLVQAVVDEMLRLQYTMAMVAFRVRMRTGEMSDAFLDRVMQITEAYQGPDRDEDLFVGLKRYRELSEKQRKLAAAQRAMSHPNTALGLVQYGIPLFTTQIADLAICSIDFQRSVLRIRYHLDLYNQLVSHAQSLFDKTFNKPTAEDREVLIAAQEQTYVHGGKRAEIIMEAIENLQKRYGSGKELSA